MKLTNRHAVPETIVRAVESFERRPIEGVLSVTQLVAPPQINVLKYEYWDDLEEDVGERLWALLGSAVHVVLERGQPDNSLAEEGLSIERRGWTITGRPDLWHDGVLTDWKTTSVFALPYPKPDWEQQLNLYALLYREHGFDVDELKVEMILRDWMSSRRGQSLNYGRVKYPEIPFATRIVPLWDHEMAMDFLDDRIDVQEAAFHGHVAPCTNEERWAKVRGTAIVYERCERYCVVAQVCDQWAVDSAIAAVFHANE